MPNFPVHATVNVLALSGIIGASVYFGIDAKQLSPFSVGFLLSTVVLSPDLDLYTSRISRNWGPLRFLIFPYSLIFHHGQHSHVPLVGTATRYLYLTGVMLLLVLLLSNLTNVSDYDIISKLWNNRLMVGYVFLGSVIADLVHKTLDFFITNDHIGIKRGDSFF
jgi:uncharacterized metal-binding protein